ncbi:hypothetical protein F4777DRAFT_596110 [Nemania sp. FL0916]|nr:hypothetical protein F4777DRAFT_596110 [Nemania sp. FL0916]
MDYICCCFPRRKSADLSSNGVGITSSTRPIASSRSQRASDGDFGRLTDLRQKCEENTLSTAEARALLDMSGKTNAPLTPREIEELHRLLSPAPQTLKPERLSSISAAEKPPCTPTNDMVPRMPAQNHLFRLPIEVRAQIWRYAMGSRKLFLVVKGGKLLQQENIQRPYWRHVNGLLNIPLICQQSSVVGRRYLESIDLLYSENTFGFGFGSVGSSKDFFTQANTLLPPQRVAAMTSIEVGIHLSGGYSQYYDSHPQAWDLSLEITAPEPLGSWNAIFKALARMRQLKNLVVVVWASGDRRHEFRMREPELMDIPAGMTGLKKFEVWLPWGEEEEEDDDDEEEVGPSSQSAGRQSSRPYVVRRNFEDRERYGVSVPNWRG